MISVLYQIRYLLLESSPRKDDYIFLVCLFLIPNLFNRACIHYVMRLKRCLIDCYICWRLNGCWMWWIWICCGCKFKFSNGDWDASICGKCWIWCRCGFCWRAWIVLGPGLYWNCELDLDCKKKKNNEITKGFWLKALFFGIYATSTLHENEAIKLLFFIFKLNISPENNIF